MSSPAPLQLAAAALFAVALLHTFSTSVFTRLALRHPRHEGLLHLLGEVEVVFGFWALVLVLLMFGVQGTEPTTAYLGSRNFTEPLFVFAIMVVAGSRPILALTRVVVSAIARWLPLPPALATCFVALSVLPLLGSLLTEPAAMTLAALMLRDQVLHPALPERVKYAVLGTLFVNISIGGTLTAFAAPPVLMVAGTWGWSSHFMLATFGWKAALAVLVNAGVLCAVFRRSLAKAEAAAPAADTPPPVPAGAMLVSAVLLAGIVAFAHHPPVFMGLLLCFMGYAQAYPRHHDRLILREALMVAFFLAGLVVLGGLQQWWLQPLFGALTPDGVYYVATALTAITDNAALTYLGSLVPGLSDEFKYSLVAGAVTGGGLTVIANAPNPAGYTILRGRFNGESIGAGWLALAAAGPTLVAIAAFRCL